MQTRIPNLLAVAAIALSTISVAPSISLAQSIELNLGREGPRVRVLEDCDPDFEDCRPRRERRDDRRDFRREERRAERGCTEDRALDKAERMGLRRARIDGSDRRTIGVRGRDRFGDRVFILFGRQPGCPILR